MQGARLAGATSLLALLLLAAFAPRSALAIYADQAGQHDWLQQHVGRVSLAALAARPRARLFVASKAGAVAALSIKDGLLLWRRVLAEGDEATHLEAAGSRLLTLTDGGKRLTAWDAGSGAAVWDATLAASSDLSGPDAAAVAVVKDLAVAVAAGTAKGYNLATGEVEWSASLAGSKGAAVVKLATAAGGEGVWVATLQPGASQLELSLLGPSGQVESSASLDAGSTRLSSSHLLLTGAAVAALSADSTTLCSAEVKPSGGSATQLACQRLSELLPAGTSVEGARLVLGSCSSHAVIQTAGGAAVVSLGASGGAAATTFVPGTAASGCFLGGSSGAVPQVALATPGGTGLQTHVVSAADGSSVEPQADIAALAPRHVGGEVVGVASLFAAPLSMGGEQAVSQLVLFEDDSLALVRGGRQAWLRHEELASIKDILFTDLPAPTHENEAQWLASQPGPGEMLSTQLLALKVQAGRLSNLPLASPEEQRKLEQYKALTSDKLRPTRDPDGFRKQLVVLTAGGKVLALHNGDGRVLWSLDFGPQAGLRKLALWRVPHDVQHDVEVMALSVGPEGTTATIINAHTGAVQQTLSSPVAAVDVLPLPQPAHDGAADQLVYVLVPAGTGGAVALLPDATAAQAAFEAARAGFSFWRVDQEAGVVRGLGFTEAGTVEERWSAALAPAAGSGSRQRILAVAAHIPGEAVGSPARVMGSGELKFKYLNPNALLVAVGEPTSAQSGSSNGGVEEDAGGQAGPRLTVVLLDAVSGRVLFSQSHEDATGPVHAALSENMAFYHFWNAEAHRWQMASVELFDASPTDLKVSDLAFSETNTTVSSWDAPPLEAGSQSFLCRLPVAGLAVTRSARGNTAKQVMLLTPSGQVYLLDRRFLDPRRPIVPPGQKPTTQQAAEGLPPYQPELPMLGPMFATLDRRVARLHGVAVETAVLESTLLMAAHGLDLFYTRLTPSKSFDMVPDDFPYALLVLIVGGMTTATVVLKMMTRRSAVKAKWQ